MTDGDTAYRAARACRRISASGSHTAADPSGVLTPKALGNDIKALRPDHANHHLQESSRIAAIAAGTIPIVVRLPAA